MAWGTRLHRREIKKDSVPAPMPLPQLRSRSSLRASPAPPSGSPRQTPSRITPRGYYILLPQGSSLFWFPSYLRSNQEHAAPGESGALASGIPRPGAGELPALPPSGCAAQAAPHFRSFGWAAFPITAPGGRPRTVPTRSSLLGACGGAGG